MTEDEYTYVDSLSTIRAAKNVMADIVPDIVEGIMPKDEYQTIMKILWKWEKELNKKIKVK